MNSRTISRLAGAFALLLSSCSEPTGLPAPTELPGRFTVTIGGAEWTGSAINVEREMEGQIIELRQRDTGNRIEIAVGSTPLLRVASEFELHPMPADYIRWVRIVIDGDAVLERIFQPVGGRHEGTINWFGLPHQMRMDLVLRNTELSLSGATQADVRLRGSLFAK